MTSTELRNVMLRHDRRHTRGLPAARAAVAVEGADDGVQLAEEREGGNKQWFLWW